MKTIQDHQYQYYNQDQHLKEYF